MPDREFHFKATNQPASNEGPKSHILRKIISFLPFFSKKEESNKENSLSGRLQIQMKHDGSHLVAQVKDLKRSLSKELKKAGELDLLRLFEAVVDPVLHEYAHIEKRLSDDEPVHDKTLDKYNNWIEKAKLWAAITTKPFDRDSLVRALLDHTISQSEIHIRRDVRTLQEYASHELHHLGLSELTLTAVASLVDREVSPHMDALIGLIETKPLDLKLENLEEWKRLLNEKRAIHYNDAFHAIDQVIQSLAPPMPERPADHHDDIDQ